MPSTSTALVSTLLSVPLSILYALEKILEKPGLGGHKELVLHILGATEKSEMMAITKYEEILHLCPGLQSLVVVRATR